MSRFEESQFPDLQMRLENLESQNWHIQYEVEQIRRTNSVIKEIRVVDLIFDPTKFAFDRSALIRLVPCKSTSFVSKP